MIELRHYTLPIGAAVLAVGVALLALSLLAGILGYPETVGFYVNALPGADTGWQGWNTVVLLASPLVVLIGGWYVGEQIQVRRRFEELVETKKKSEFRKEIAELEDLARRLPPRYGERLEQRKDELNL